MKKDFAPTLLDFGTVQVYLSRHFGFCYGVENAIEIAFRTVQENPGKRIFLLSEMIHNPQVNKDLESQGVKFLHDTKGNELISINEITGDDIVLIPAFGTTLKMEAALKEKGIPTEKYDTTCPFVEKVWNRSAQIAGHGYAIIIHGKPVHEETRATFSHASDKAPSLVINDMAEAVLVADFIKGKMPVDEFSKVFKGRFSEGFDAEKDLQRIGVVNQTTMLASDTQAISDFLKQAMIEKFSLTEETVANHFADTKDTLCYATNDNQSAVYGLLQHPADIAIVVGGYNSSNTSHLVELCEEKLPTYFIKDASEILSSTEIRHFDMHNHEMKTTENYLPQTAKPRILITSGASCPDAIVESVMEKIVSFYGKTLADCTVSL